MKNQEDVTVQNSSFTFREESRLSQKISENQASRYSLHAVYDSEFASPPPPPNGFPRIKRLSRWLNLLGQLRPDQRLSAEAAGKNQQKHIFQCGNGSAVHEKTHLHRRVGQGKYISIIQKPGFFKIISLQMMSICISW